MSETRANILTGLAVIAVLVVLGVWVSADDGEGDRGVYSVSARFDQVDGVSVGAPVYLAGIKVGEVSHVRLETKTLKPVLTLSIRAGVVLPVDSAALILSDGVLGGKFVKIDPGAEDDAMKQGDRFEHVQSAVILEQVLERVVITAEERLKKARAGNGEAPPAPAPGPSPEK